MSVVCVRDYTMVVGTAGPPQPSAYYNLDAWDGVAVRDYFGVRDLDDNFGLSVALAAGKIGNCYTAPSSSRTNGRLNADMSFDAIPFTVRFWLNVPSGTAANKDLWRVQNAFGTQVFCQYQAADDSVVFGLTGLNKNARVTGVAFDAWLYCVVWYDPAAAGGTVAVRVDNGVEVTKTGVGAVGGSPFLSASDRFYLISGGCQIDELAIWFNYLFVAADYVSDYNSGDGQTWPW